MKKLLYLLIVLVLPFCVFADVLPEPSDLEWIIDNKEWLIIWETTEDTIEELSELWDIDALTNEEDSEDSMNEINMTATEISTEDSWLHEIWDDWWMMRVSFGYCNEWLDNLSQTLNYAINQWTPFKVCFMLWNSANQDIKVQVRLVDLVNWLCSVTRQSIHQFVSEDDLESLKEITIPAWNYVVKEFSILYPVWIEWDQWACTIFNIIKDEVSSATISTIVNRAYPMKFFVWTLDDIKNEITVDNVELSLDDNKDLIMNFDIKNEWNLENLVELSGTISNIFGYSKKFSIEWWHVLPGGVWHVTANLGSIPSYGWLFNIDFKAFATPYFSYDISKSSIDPSLIEMKTFEFNTSYFQMPWLIFAIAIIVILLIITLFRKPKQNVVYVQAPQQPMPNQGYQQPQYTQPQQPQYQAPQQPVQPQPQYPNNPQYGQPMQQNPQPTPPQYNPNN